MHKVNILFIILLGSFGYSQDSIKSTPNGLQNFIELTDKMVSSGNYNSILRDTEHILSGEISDSSGSSFDGYLDKINKLNESEIIPSINNKIRNSFEEVIFNELLFRTIVAIQHNLERLYWEMPDRQKYLSSIVFATTNKELSEAKTGLLSKQLSLISSSGNEDIKLRTWLAVRRMLNQIDITLSESGNQFVQRSPYGIMIRQGELRNKLEVLAADEENNRVKKYAEESINSILSSGKKYKDLGRPIIIGAGPEVTDLISKEALEYFNLALGSGDHMKKAALYTKAIESDSNFSAAFFNRGVSYFEMENYPAAIKDFEYVIRIDSAQSDVYPRLGDSYLRTEAYQSAIDYYSKALEHETPDELSIVLNRGIAFEKLHKYEEAISDFSKAALLDTSSLIAYNNRVQCYVALKDYNNAISDYETLIRLRPKNSSYYFNLGCIYWEYKNWEKVNEIWEKGLAVNPKDQNILKNLPEIKLKLSNP